MTRANSDSIELATTTTGQAGMRGLNPSPGSARCPQPSARSSFYDNERMELLVAVQPSGRPVGQRGFGVADRWPDVCYDALRTSAVRSVPLALAVASSLRNLRFQYVNKAIPSGTCFATNSGCSLEAM